jgi:hypothetical protein
MPCSERAARTSPLRTVDRVHSRTLLHFRAERVIFASACQSPVNLLLFACKTAVEAWRARPLAADQPHSTQRPHARECQVSAWTPVVYPPNH